tara:strand:+ start:1531 stop:1656 length:126 start_codon:yes stop_codon:yes gene_type:complete
MNVPPKVYRAIIEVEVEVEFVVVEDLFDQLATGSLSLLGDV